MLLDALFRSKSLENPSTPITGDAVDTDGLFRADVYVSPETAMKLAAVYSCIYVLSSSLAQMPLHVMRRYKGKVEPARDHPAFYLFDKESYFHSAHNTFPHKTGTFPLWQAFYPEW